MRAGFWAYVAAAFFTFSSLGLALFFVDDVLPHAWRPLVVPLRLGLVALGAVGGASVIAHSRGWPGARSLVRASVVVGAAACVAWIVVVCGFALSSPAGSFRRGKVQTLVVAAGIGLVSFALVGEGTRRVWLKTGAPPAS
jgi:hypothetical protein